MLALAWLKGNRNQKKKLEAFFQERPKRLVLPLG
jgi:hypothetical protein